MTDSRTDTMPGEGVSMTNLRGVVARLTQERTRAVKQVERLDAALAALNGFGKRTRNRQISVAGRARIAAAQRARWAKVKAKGKKNVV